MNANVRRPDRVLKHLQLANGAERVEQYDLLGRLQQVDEPDGSSLRYGYGTTGDLDWVRHSGGERVDYRRDDNVLRAITARVETDIVFDDGGFPIRLTYRIDGNEWRIDYQRNTQGSVTAIRYPHSTDWLQVGSSLQCGEQRYVIFDAPHIVFSNGARTSEYWSRDANTASAAASQPQSPSQLQSPSQRRLARIVHSDARTHAQVDQSYDYDAQGRVARAGAQRFTYDESNRLSDCDDRTYQFDERGRLMHSGDMMFEYGDAPCALRAGNTIFAYDALGRRSARQQGDAVQRYEYNLFGQLARVQLADGSSIQYLYDGFGRLVGREDAHGAVFYLVDFEGRRLADGNASGAVTRSYLWFGATCIGAIDGACGAPLAQSFHRVHGGTLAAIGDAHGNLHRVDHADPYGADSPISDTVPGYACLFGDAATGLLHASTRWLDPTIGQFISADSWFGTHALDRLPRGARPILDALPGGTGRLLDAQTAYDWCARDPVNYCDPNGHNFMGLVWSTISAFLWSMQVTSVAFQMELISLVIFILSTFPGFMWAWNTDGWKRIAPWNALPPLLGSTRLMVPFAFPLNSIWNAGGQVFTMGNVIWVNGDQMSTLENTSQRDLIECSNAASYRASTQEVAADAFRVRSPHAVATATADASGGSLTGVTITTPSPAPGSIGDVFSTGDWIGIRLQGATDPAELREISGMAGGAISFADNLPATYFSQAVDIARLDAAVVRLQKEDINAARTLKFIRGNALHIIDQLPEKVPSSGLSVAEYMPAGVRAQTTATATREAELVRLADKGDQPLYAANEFLRIRAGADFSARLVSRLRGTRDLILNAPLPSDPTGVKYAQVEVAKMAAAGAAVVNQSAAGDRVNVGPNNAGSGADMRKGDGLAIDNTGGAPVTTERRIVRQLFLNCAIAALPAALQNVALGVDLMIADTSKQAKGKNSSATDIDTAKDEAGRFSADQPVRVRKNPNTDFFTTIATVDAANNKLTLGDALPAGDFPNGTDVTVHLLTATKRLPSEPTASGTDISLSVDTPASPVQGDVIRVRDASAVQGGAIRQIAAPPNVLAQVDSAMPASHVANLSVQRFAAVANTVKGNAAAPLVQLRFTIAGAANPFVQNDELLLSSTAPDEEGYGKVIAAPVGQVIELEHPIEFALATTAISVQRILPTGATTLDAKLAESLILIPSDPDEEPITRRRAVESHEMRHVWQYSVLGPFFFSFPLPWLINLGFSAFGSEATGNSANKVMRHIGLGGLDSIFSLIAWGIGAAAGVTSKAADDDGEIVDTALKTIQFPADADPKKIETFTEGSPCEAGKGDYKTFNVIDTLDLAQKRITLRFALESDKFAVNDKVNISVSPFEKIRATVNKWFSLNLEQLWSEHIPVSWGRVLSKFLNRDSWFPLLGLYPIGFAMAGGDQRRMHFEQDASYHSGDLYNNFATSSPADIYVGQFSRVTGFLMGRGAGDTATGLSDADVLEFMTVETPSITGVQPEAMVFGGVAASRRGRVRFRESYYMRMSDKVENAVGAFFAASQPGIYILHVPGELPAGDLVTTVGFSADFQKLRTITVKSIGVAPAGTAADPLYETETLTFKISGDAKAKYDLQYNGAPPAVALTFDAGDSTRVTVPVGAVGNHTLDIKATYKRTDEVFKGGGQLQPIALSDAQLSNVCQPLPVTVAALVAPTIGATQAGTRQTFSMPIAPASIAVTSALPAGAAINASVINGSGRPAQLTFVAPDAVTAATDVTFDMVFGRGANTKTVSVTVPITPAP